MTHARDRFLRHKWRIFVLEIIRLRSGHDQGELVRARRARVRGDWGWVVLAVVLEAEVRAAAEEADG